MDSRLRRFKGPVVAPYMLHICPASLKMRDICGTYAGHMRGICGTYTTELSTEARQLVPAAGRVQKPKPGNIVYYLKILCLDLSIQHNTEWAFREV